MKLSFENLDKLVKKVRKDLELDITFDYLARSIEFEASKNFTESLAYYSRKRISYQKMKQLSNKEVTNILTKHFERL